MLHCYSIFCSSFFPPFFLALFLHTLIFEREKKNFFETSWREYGKFALLPLTYTHSERNRKKMISSGLIKKQTFWKWKKFWIWYWRPLLKELYLILCTKMLLQIFANKNEPRKKIITFTKYQVSLMNRNRILYFDRQKSKHFPPSNRKIPKNIWPILLCWLFSDRNKEGKKFFPCP